MFYILLGIVLGICFLETIITGFRCVLTYEKKSLFLFWIYLRLFIVLTLKAITCEGSNNREC